MASSRVADIGSTGRWINVSSRVVTHAGHGACDLYSVLKRGLDVLVALPVVVVVVVPMTVIGFVVTGGHPLYSQVRVGRGGRLFRIWKFRTMVRDADDVEKYLSPAQREQWRRERKVTDDPRVTRAGRFLRRTSLDELANMLNVLAGDMSLVGPRAVSRDEILWYGSRCHEILSVRPGVTGYWQVTERNAATFENGRRQELELSSVRSRSFRTDVRLLLATPAAVLRRTGL